MSDAPRIFLRAGVIAALLALSSCTASESDRAAGGLVERGIIFTAAQTARAAAEGVPLSEPYWTPAAADVAAAEARLAATLAAMSNERAYTVSRNLSTYRRQYLGYAVQGRPFIYINAFCRSPDESWREHLLVAAGGTCYFQAAYDAEADAIAELRINPDS
jgi:hypothetical protein